MGPGPLIRFTNNFPQVFLVKCPNLATWTNQKEPREDLKWSPFQHGSPLTALALLATLVSGETQELATHPVMGLVCQRVGLKRGGEM